MLLTARQQQGRVANGFAVRKPERSPLSRQGFERAGIDASI
jgi:predicted XRE-type DNA-binding protein